MATYAMTVGGTTVHWVTGSLNIQLSAAGRPSLSCDLRSLDASYRPALGADVIVTENGNALFGGSISRTSETGTVKGQFIITRIEAVGFAALAERHFLTSTFTWGPISGGDGWIKGPIVLAAGTLKSQLTTLVTYLSTDSVTLDAGQANGPTMPELSYLDTSVSDVLNDLMVNATKLSAAEWTWDIGSTKALLATSAASVAAPYDVTTANQYALGDVSVERVRNAWYANRVYLRFGSGPLLYRDSWTGDGVTDTFTLKFKGATVGWAIEVGAGPTYETVTVGAGGDWQYDNSTNTIQRMAGAPGMGVAIVFYYWLDLPRTVMAEDTGQQATYGIWEAWMPDEPSILDVTEAEARVAAGLAARLVMSTTVRYETKQTGVIRPGMSQTITMAGRGLSGSFVVQDVGIRNPQSDDIHRVVTAQSGATLQGNWRDVWNGMMGGGAKSSSAGDVVGSAVTVPGGPNTAVQYNDAGSFGGDAYTLIDKDATGDVYGDSSVYNQAQVRLAVGVADAAAGTTYGDGGSSDYAPQAWWSGTWGKAAALVLQQIKSTGAWRWTTNKIVALYTSAGYNVGCSPFTLNNSSATDANQPLQRTSGRLQAWGLHLKSDVTGGASSAATSKSDFHVVVDTSSAAKTLALPALSDSESSYQTAYGRIWVIEVQGVYDCTVDPDGSELIEGQATLVLKPGQRVMAIANRSGGSTTGWHVLASHTPVGLRTYEAIISLTDAQIKAWPTGDISITLAPGANWRAHPLAAWIEINSAGGAYTNIHADAYINIHTADWQADTLSYLVNGNTTGLTKVTELLTAATEAVSPLLPYAQGDAAAALAFAGGWGFTSNTIDAQSAENQALVATFENHGSGALTGGNAANTGRIVVRYTLEPVA